MKTKKVLAIFAMMLLAVPVCTWAGAVPDTGQTECYDDTNAKLGTNPSRCYKYSGDEVPCTRIYLDDGDKEIKYYGASYDDPTKFAQIYWAPEAGKCYKDLEDYEVVDCPNPCYSDNKGENSLTCPSSREGTSGSDDYYGGDGYYSTNPPSYTKLAEDGITELEDKASDFAMIRDNVTGLIWEAKKQKDSTPNSADLHDADNIYALDSDGTDETDTKFLSFLRSLKWGGYVDWRLPTVKELAYLVDAGADNPISSTFFPGMTDEEGETPFAFWTSSPYAYANPDETGKAWAVDFNGGGVVRAEAKTTAYHVIAVSDGKTE